MPVKAYDDIVRLVDNGGRRRGIDIPRSPGWTIGGVVAVLVLFVVLAPGIPR